MMAEDQTVSFTLETNRLEPRLNIFSEKSRRFPESETTKIREQLEAAYEDVKEEFDTLVEEELLTDYLEAIECDEDENIYRKTLIENNYALPAMKFANVQTNHRKFQLHEDVSPELDEELFPQNMPVFTLQTGEIHLQMNYWIPVELSIVTKEWRRVTHVPKPIYINDWILYKLMRQMLEGFNGVPDLFYYAIYKKWPNKWTQVELSSDFPWLCDQFAEDSYDVTRVEPWKTKQIVANDQENVCYACLEFMCPTHGFVAKVPAQFPDGEFYKVKVPLPNLNDKTYCSEKCWKVSRFDDVIQILEATDDEKQCHTVIAYINKHKAATAESEEGLLAAVYGVKSDTPFCEFAKMFIDPDSETPDIRTCQSVYHCILKTVERPSTTRLEYGKPLKQLEYKTRLRNFRIHQNTMTLERSDDDQLRRTEISNDNPSHATVPLIGCEHVGPCGKEKDKCVCTTNGICSHLCRCDVNCKLRFPGCMCAPGQCKTNACPCSRFNWSCIPQTCKSCNCGGSPGSEGTCSNTSFMSFTSKRLRAGPSKIAGYGLFIVDGAEKNEYITEYVGERISNEEAERRGAVYDELKCSYLFDLQTGGALDAYRVGNLARFANHSSTNPNCYIRQMFVAGEERVGLFAKEKLEPGVELTFDYCYSQEQSKNYFEDPKLKRSKK